MLSFPFLRWLWLGGAVLVVGHLATLVNSAQFGDNREYGVSRQFDLNAEANLAAWYESFLLLCAAGLTFLLATHFRAQRAPLAHRWVALSVVIGVMAIDEAAQLHDLFTGPLRRGLELDFGIFYFAWLIPAVGFLAVSAWYFAPLARSVPAGIHGRLLVAAGVYFGGSVLTEMISGYVAAHGRRSTPYLAVLTIEETLEIVGVLLVIGALVQLVHRLEVRTILVVDGRGSATVAPTSYALQDKNTF